MQQLQTEIYGIKSSRNMTEQIVDHDEERVNKIADELKATGNDQRKSRSRRIEV